ncbi:MAG: homocysteine S-methyltransferase family protein [Pseudomonadota bacterium]
MSRYERFMARIARGERILIDGATGTEIERRGVPQLENAWNGGGALSDPEVLQAVHEDYIRAGAEIVIANTFATHRQALRAAGEEERFEAYNREGVALAIAARERSGRGDVLVAGGISYWSWVGDWSAPEDLRESTAEMAAIMASAGVDLLMLEMMVDIESMLVVLEAAQTTGLPVWVGLSCEADGAGGMRLLRGGALADAIAALDGRGVPLLSIMHTEVEDVDACLDVVQERWSGPVGVYAHSSRCENGKRIYGDRMPVDRHAHHAKGWLERGVQVIGTCCGLGVGHVEALKELV